MTISHVELDHGTQAAELGGRIVVGVDGSADSRRALSWAHCEAQARGVELEVVRAWSVPFAWSDGAGDRYADDESLFAAEARAEVEEMVDELLDGAPRPPWLSVVTLRGSAAPLLVERSRSAGLLVVGSRGRSHLTNVLLGSVSATCSHRARCAVAIVPSHA